MSDDIAKLIQFYNLATSDVIVEIPYYTEFEFVEGDEVEMPTLGAFKIVGRRWSISQESVILVLLLEPLA